MLLSLQTWPTGNVSDENIVGDVTPGGYAFHHAARIHKKIGGVGMHLRDSLKLPTGFCIWKDKCSGSYYLPITPH